MADIVEHGRTGDGFAQLLYTVWMGSRIFVRAPHHERNHILPTEHLTRIAAEGPVVAPEVVAVVVDFLTMIGEVDDNGILLAIEADDLLKDVVVIEGGIVVMDYILEHLFCEPGLLAEAETVFIKMVEVFRITVFKAYMLAKEVEEEETVGGVFTVYS